MAITYSTVEGHLEQAITDVGNDSFAAARKSVTKARIAFAAIPNSGQGQANVSWERKMDDVMQAIADAEAATNRIGNRQRTAAGRSRFAR